MHKLGFYLLLYLQKIYQISTRQYQQTVVFALIRLTVKELVNSADPLVLTGEDCGNWGGVRVQQGRCCDSLGSSSY